MGDSRGVSYKANIPLPQDAATPLLEGYVNELATCAHIKIDTQMFREVLFLTDKT